MKFPEDEQQKSDAYNITILVGVALIGLALVTSNNFPYGLFSFFNAFIFFLASIVVVAVLGGVTPNYQTYFAIIALIGVFLIQICFGFVKKEKGGKGGIVKNSIIHVHLIMLFFLLIIFLIFFQLQMKIILKFTYKWKKKILSFINFCKFSEMKDKVFYEYTYQMLFKRPSKYWV